MLTEKHLNLPGQLQQLAIILRFTVRFSQLYFNVQLQHLHIIWRLIIQLLFNASI